MCIYVYVCVCIDNGVTSFMLAAASGAVKLLQRLWCAPLASDVEDSGEALQDLR